MLKLDIFKTFLCFAVLRFYGVAARPQPGIEAPQKRAPTATLELRTNAARMAAGLPPLQPRQLYDATRVQARHDGGSPSAVPYSGRIKVVSAHGVDVIGYVQEPCAGITRFSATYGINDKFMSVSFSSSSSSTPFNLAIAGAGPPPYLGFAGSDLGGWTKNDLTRTEATPPGSVSLPVGNGMWPGKPNSESALWYFNSMTKELTARWVNANASPVDSFFWFVPNGSPDAGLYLVGSTWGVGDGWEVKFYLD